MDLTDIEILAIARRLQGMDNYNALPVDPFLAHMLSNVKPNDMDQVRHLAGLLGQDVLSRVFACDPKQEIKLIKLGPASETLPVSQVPELPGDIKLTTEQSEAAKRAGTWLNDYVELAGNQANETPLLFHLVAGLILGAMAIGRRMYVATPWSDIFPNLYVMVVAVSTYYRKTASLRLATKTAELAFPHMLMPHPGSPENFLRLLEGRLPSQEKLDKMTQGQQERARLSAAFAAQRTIFQDEISGLFKSMRKDYMAGLKEHIMLMHDAPSTYTTSTNGHGESIIRSIAPSVYGLTTPAELSRSVHHSDWENGTLARFLLLSPEEDYMERPAATTVIPFDPLAERLRRLHLAIPTPPLPDENGDWPSPNPWSLSSNAIFPLYSAYGGALRTFTKPDSPLDDRLRAVYGRLHDQALKIAIILAALDWADKDRDNRSERPEIELPHWYRAMEIAEICRASAHQVLHGLSQSEDYQIDRRIFNHLKSYPSGETRRELMMRTGLASQVIERTLKVLVEAGDVEIVERKGARGPVALLYKPV